MNYKKMISICLMSVFLVSCAHEKSQTDPSSGINPDKIRDILHNNIPKFKSCYQSELDASIKLKKSQVSVVFKFTVDEKGNVSKSEIDSSSLPAGLAIRCIKIILDELKFPATTNAKSYEVTQPINFYPKNL